MTLRLTDHETDALRRRAELEGRSMQEVTRQAIREYIESHSRADLLDRVLDEELPRYAEALERLGPVIYLTRAEILRVAERAVGPGCGGARSRTARVGRGPARPPRCSAPDAYPTLDDKAAALLHSLARNHALVDGNKRLALAGVIAFYGMNGRRLTLTNDEAYDLIIAVASGTLDTVDGIAADPARGHRRSRRGVPPHRAGGSRARHEG